MTDRPAGFPPLEILYDDPHLLAVLKPAGVLVQKDQNTRWSLYDEVRQRLDGGFAGVLHRLDKPVCGIVLFAKTPAAAAAMSAMFRTRDPEKTYHAVLKGVLEEKKAKLVHWIGKNQRKAVVSRVERPGTKRCELEYEVLEERAGRSLVRIRLGTGRYNQIRAQFAYIKRPVAGDFKYDGSSNPSSRIGLVASSLAFTHPFTNEPVELKIENFLGMLSEFWD
jgi:23S rRNA pseudouridine1911/1915/1917 synthase